MLAFNGFYLIHFIVLNFKNISNISHGNTSDTSQHYQDEGYCVSMKLRLTVYDTTNWLYHAKKSGISLNLNFLIERLKEQLCLSKKIANLSGVVIYNINLNLYEEKQ